MDLPPLVAEGAKKATLIKISGIKSMSKSLTYALLLSDTSNVLTKIFEVSSLHNYNYADIMSQEAYDILPLNNFDVDDLDVIVDYKVESISKIVLKDKNVLMHFNVSILGSDATEGSDVHLPKCMYLSTLYKPSDPSILVLPKPSVTQNSKEVQASPQNTEKEEEKKTDN